MIQSFLVEETKELIYDADKLDEWKAKVEELGLNEQLKLVEGEKSPVPFEIMNQKQQRIFEILCPEKTDYKKYKKTAIPLEALSLISLCVVEEYFDKIEIWADNKDPDPLAVGYKGSDKYLIVRWGDVISSLETLYEKAKNRLAHQKRIEGEKRINNLKQDLENLQNRVESYLEGDSWTVLSY